MFNLLFDTNGLRYENVFFFQNRFISKNIGFQIKFVLGYHTFSDSEEEMKHNEGKHNSVSVFDYITCERKINIRNDTMGKHNNTDVCYICQSYSKIHKTTDT